MIGWILFFALMGLAIWFFRRPKPEKPPETARPASAAAPAAAKKDHKSHSSGPSLIFLAAIVAIPSFLIFVVQMGYLATGGPPTEHNLPTATSTSGTYLTPATVCGSSEEEPLVATIPAGAISATFENASDDQKLVFLPNLDEETVELYAGSKRSKCGSGLSNTDRWCVKNISDKPIEFSCWVVDN